MKYICIYKEIKSGNIVSPRYHANTKDNLVFITAYSCRNEQKYGTQHA